MNVNIYEELKKTIINILYYIIIFVFIQLQKQQKQNGNVVDPQMMSDIQNNNMKNVSINVDENKKKVSIINIYISR